jgi:hypothetical protein
LPKTPITCPSLRLSLETWQDCLRPSTTHGRIKPRLWRGIIPASLPTCTDSSNLLAGPAQSTSAPPHHSQSKKRCTLPTNLICGRLICPSIPKRASTSTLAVKSARSYPATPGTGTTRFPYCACFFKGRVPAKSHSGISPRVSVLVTSSTHGKSSMTLAWNKVGEAST